MTKRELRKRMFKELQEHCNHMQALPIVMIAGKEGLEDMIVHLLMDPTYNKEWLVKVLRDMADHMEKGTLERIPELPYPGQQIFRTPTPEDN